MIRFIAAVVPVVFLINGLTKQNWLEAFCLPWLWQFLKMAASSNFGNMFSVVGASAFLPTLPIRVLTNNLLYDFSQTTIPQTK
jgi:hypothetical protein